MLTLEMPHFGGFHGHVKRSRRALAATLVPSVALVVLIALISVAFDIPVERLLSDPLAEAGVHPLLGFLSNLGILVWAGSAGVCLVAVLVLRHGAGSVDAEYLRFFAAAGALTTILVLDDTYQFHEDLILRTIGRGQTFVLLGYVVAVTVFLWRFRRVVLGTEWLILGAAGVAFAVSIAVDLLPVALGLLPGDLEVYTRSESYEFVSSLLEDGTKFVGICLWLAYFVRTAVAAVVGMTGTR